MSTRTPVVREAVRSLLILAGGVMAGFAGLLGLFKLGLAGGIDILFYRGVLLCAVACVATVTGLALLARTRARVTLSEAIAAGALSLGLNLSFLVVAPVTIDRSISVFLLAQMAARDDATFSTRDMEEIFRTVYLGDLDQIQRRMTEQVRTGNLVPADGGYKITPQGTAFIRSARIIGPLFDADARLLAARPPRVQAENRAH